MSLNLELPSIRYGEIYWVQVMNIATDKWENLTLTPFIDFEKATEYYYKVSIEKDYQHRNMRLIHQEVRERTHIIRKY